MILDSICASLEQGPSWLVLLGDIYTLLREHPGSIWFSLGALLGIAILAEPARMFVKWTITLLAAAIVGTVIFAELASNCFVHISLPGTMSFLVNSEGALLVGLSSVALLHWFFGPRLERLLDRLTGASHARKDHLSDIRTVDSEIPRRPRDFDPREYFSRKPS